MSSFLVALYWEDENLKEIPAEYFTKALTDPKINCNITDSKARFVEASTNKEYYPNVIQEFRVTFPCEVDLEDVEDFLLNSEDYTYEKVDGRKEVYMYDNAFYLRELDPGSNVFVFGRVDGGKLDAEHLNEYAINYLFYLYDQIYVLRYPDFSFSIDTDVEILNDDSTAIIRAYVIADRFGKLSRDRK